MHSERTIIIVSHEASMTGAPLIILRIAEQLHAKFGVDIVNVICQGGELQGDFEALPDHQSKWTHALGSRKRVLAGHGPIFVVD